MTMTSGIYVHQRSFLQRLRSMALWWGIPAVCVELFWVPRDLWLYAVILIVPATAVGVVTGAAVLHLVASRRSKNDGESHLRPK